MNNPHLIVLNERKEFESFPATDEGIKAALEFGDRIFLIDYYEHRSSGKTGNEWLPRSREVTKNDD